MPATIFCTFTGQDYANIAIGRLRRHIHGVTGISYVREYQNLQPFGQSCFRLANTTAPASDHPVMVQITCQHAAVDSIAAKLKNLHGYNIITLPHKKPQNMGMTEPPAEYKW